MALSVFASSSFAQGNSVITGTVNDAATNKPVADVVVTASSPSLLGEEVVVTDETGTYRIPQLPAGTYSLKLEREAYKLITRPNIVLKAEHTVRANMLIQPEAIEGNIDIIAIPPTVDINSTTSGTNVGQDFIKSVALLRPTANGIRSFEGLAQAAPQVTVDQFGFAFSGATSAENQIFVDGVSVNDPQVGTNGAQMPVDFVEQANVITGGYMAEYGRAGGGVLNVVTKSGSNEFHGSVFANYTPGIFASQSPAVKQLGSTAVVTNRTWNIADFGAEIGGPIVKDRLWFFAGFSPSFNRIQRQRTLNKYQVDVDPDTGDESYATDPLGNYLTTSIEGSERNRFDDRRALMYIAKLTFLINSNNNIALSVMGSNENRTSPAFANRLFDLSNTESSLTTSIKYAGSFFDKRLLLDATVGYFRQTNQPFNMPGDGSTIASGVGSSAVPSIVLTDERGISLTDVEAGNPAAVIAACSPAPGTTLPPCPATAVGVTFATGGFGFMQQNNMDRVQARAAATYLVTALGHHVLKAGIDYEYDRYNVIKGYSGGVTSRQSTDGQTFFDIRSFGYLTAPDQLERMLAVNVTPTTNQFGGYLQDSWQILDRVTLNAGLRYDSQQLYDATGRLGMALNNMYSPRIGVIWDPTNKGQAKLFGNFARYYQAMPLNIADRALSGENVTGFTRICTEPVNDPNAVNSPACQNYRFNGANGSPSSNNPSRYAVVTGQGRSPIDPNLQAQAKDELSFGGELEVLPSMRVGVTYTRSWMLSIIEDMSNDEGSTYFIGNPGVGLAASFPKATRDYDAVTAYATKAMSDGWFAQASYTWSYLRGNWAGFVRPETGQLDPGSNSTFDLKSLLGNQDGPLPGDRTHSVKIFASKQFNLPANFHVLLGLTYIGASGTPINYFGSHQQYGAGESYILPRGSGGRTPFVHDISLKGAVGYQLSKDMNVELTIDMLNMMNFAGVTAVDENYTQENVLPYTVAKGENPQSAICADTPNASCITKVVKSDDNSFLPASQISPNFKQPAAYQPPRQVRFGIRFSF